MKDSYTDEYTFGAEQEIVSDLRGYVTFIRKAQKNTFGRYDRLRTIANFTPVKALDPGPDGIAGGSDKEDDRIITVFETGVPPDMTDYYLTNKPIGDTYDSVEIGVVKRMRDNWQLISGFTWTKRNLSSLFSEDPNIVAWNGTNTQTTGWTFKASGSYLFEMGRAGRLLLQRQEGRGVWPHVHGHRSVPDAGGSDSGRPRWRKATSRSWLRSPGRTTCPPPTWSASLRRRQFVIKGSLRLHLTFSVYNIVGNDTVTGVYQYTSQSFGYPTSRMGKTVVRFSARFTF